jgi:hypothetical protein
MTSAQQSRTGVGLRIQTAYLLLPPSHLGGAAGRRPAGLAGYLSRQNVGSAWLTVARSRSTLALGMALRCVVFHTLTVDGLSVVRYHPGRTLRLQPPHPRDWRVVTRRWGQRATGPGAQPGGLVVALLTGGGRSSSLARWAHTVTQRSQVQIPPPLLLSAGQGPFPVWRGPLRFVRCSKTCSGTGLREAWQRDRGDGVTRDETAWTW